jgi:TPR repeat protein
MENLNEQIKRAERGDAEAQYDVAWYIVWEEPGGPIEPDWLERAVDYYERSAEQGNADAMLDLGAMYLMGRGVAGDKGKAFYWYNKAAGLLHPKAFRCLGYWVGVPISTGYLDPAMPNVDYMAAFGYFLKGALLDEQNSLYEIGDMYFSGKYVEADQDFAFSLYKESYGIIEYIEDDCFADVCIRLGECYYRGIGCEQDTDAARGYLDDAVRGYELRIKRGESPEHLMGGYNRAKFLLKRLDGDAKIEQSSVMLEKQDNGYSDFLKSEWLDYPMPEFPIPELEQLKAENPIIDEYEGLNFVDELISAENGDCNAMYRVAFYCNNRFEDETNNERLIAFSLYYYHKAIREGCRDAAYNLGCIYYHGDCGVEADKDKALKLYQFTNAEVVSNELGVIYASGEIVPQDYERAFKFFAKGALYKSSLRYAPLENLSTMYRNGNFVDTDVSFADYLLGLSKENEKESEFGESSV